MSDLNDQSFEGQCNTCGQPYIGAEVERLEAELDKLKRDLDAAQRAALKHYNGWCSGQAANELLEVAGPLWQEWRDTDITEDEDRWANFCNRAHRWHDRVIAHVAGQTSALEFDDTVSRLKEVARSHGWTLKSWGLQRLHHEEPKSGKLEAEMAKLGLHHVGESHEDVKRRREGK